MFRRLQRAAAFFFILPSLAQSRTGIIQVTGMRTWSHADSTRVIIETTGPVDFTADRAVNPDRLFFDLRRASPWIDQKRYAARAIDDTLVRRVRIAETSPGTTRIVFDLTGPDSFTVSKLEAPNRLVIEIRPPAAQIQESRAHAAHAAETPSLSWPFSGPVPRRVRAVQTVALPPLVEPPPLRIPYLPGLNRNVELARLPPFTPVFRLPVPAVSPPPRPLPYNAKAMASENASRSLTRALGLKVNRIVIDAGHGGHDVGTTSPEGVVEKDVVLDVALRLARLVQSKMGADVVLTRSDDRYIPLQERTAIANSAKADLFLSIHANSSPSNVVAGTETFYLNFTNSPGATEVAARENSGAENGVGELRDLIQTITLNDKIAESQTFAQSVQGVLSTQAARSNAAARNRGVKRAPFVVLIGASMPSVLAEIGFLTNARDASNLGKPEYRQKIAEALYKGLWQYSQSLSHFELTKGAGLAEPPVMVGLR